MKTVKTQGNFIGIIASILIMTIMVAVADFLGEKEVIFPEIAAICIGAFLAPQMSWKVSYLRMIVFVTLCAVLGVLIVILAPGPLWVQLILAYITGQLVFMYSKTSFAPMISAIALPVLLQTKSIIYLISAFSLTAVIAIFRYAFERKSFLPENGGEKTALPAKRDYIRFALRTLVFVVAAYCCIHFGVKFFVAPPLLVAFTELSNPSCKAATRKFSVIFLVALCAFTGAMARFFIVEKAGICVVVAAVVVSSVVVILIKSFKLYFPPAGAMAILPFLVPAEVILVYPLQVLAGISFFVFAGLLIQKAEK